MVNHIAADLQTLEESRSRVGAGRKLFQTSWWTYGTAQADVVGFSMRFIVYRGTSLSDMYLWQLLNSSIAVIRSLLLNRLFPTTTV